jgi:hypothetical protein
MKDKSVFESFDNFVVIKPESHEAIPIFCPMCSFPMRDAEDILMYNEKKCCFSCDTWFVLPNKEYDPLSEYGKKYLNHRKQRMTISFDLR